MTVSSATTLTPPTPAQNRVSTVLKTAIKSDHLADECPCAIFYDIPQLIANINALRRAFPKDTLHAFAVKAAPMPALLRHLHAAGMGGECASIAELALCQAAGMHGSKIVYDSPAKTLAHLKVALKAGVHINADCIEEVEMLAKLRSDMTINGGTVGMRINPQLGAAKIQETFTAAAACKFGEALKGCREEIVDVYLRYPFLNAVHVHVGSQGCEMDTIVQAVQEIVSLVEEINQKGGKIQVIDIGGGLSVDYWEDGEITNFETLAKKLRTKVPSLFHFRLVTEFGRRLCASAGFIAARVQAVKQSGGKTFVICHVGADILMRPVYQKEKWGHRVEVYDAKGNLKQGEETIVDFAGPLCFSGDIFAVNRKVILPEPGDIVVVRDAGAYTVSMYSRHTSQLVPAIYGFDANNPNQLELLKKRETVEDVVRFWDM